MPPAIPSKKTGKVIRQGQTAANLYGNDPTVKGPPAVEADPRDLNP